VTDAENPDPLTWLAPILWPDGATGLVATDDRPRWWASPSADRPRILIPAGSGAAAAQAVRRYHDGFGPARRLRSLTAEAVMGLPPLARLALRGTGVVPVAGPDAGPGLLDGLRELLGLPDLLVAVSLAAPKSNRKPVLQLIDRSGRCRGWAKVGWNPWTTGLLGNEARWLRRPAPAPLASPRLLHDVELCGRRVVVTTGVEPSRLPRRRPGRTPPTEVFRAVAAMGPRDTVRLQDSAWWASVEAVLHGATGRERAAIEAAADACERVALEVGAWHGDLTPWNLMTGPDRVQLIDWEFAADGVPIGFDLCHFHTQVGSEMRGASADAALDRSARLAPQGLAALGVEAGTRTAVWRLYLVELLRRTAALRLDGYPVERLRHGPAALARLERSIGRRPGSVRQNAEAREVHP